MFFFFNNNFLNLILKSFLKNKLLRLKHKRFNTFRLMFIIYIVLNKEVPTKLFFLRYQNFLTKTLKIFYQLS